MNCKHVFSLAATAIASMLLLNPAATAAESVGEITYIGYHGAPLNLIEQVAIDQGLFEKHGLKVTFTGAGSGQQMAAALLGGSAEVGVMTTTVTAPLMKSGQCITYLTSGPRTYYNLLAQPDLDLPNADKPFPENLVDLKGKKIALNARGTAMESMINALLAEAGLQPEDVTLIATGGPAANAVAAFRAGQVDVMMAYPISEQLLQPGEYKDLSRLMDIEGGNPIFNLTQVFSATSCDYAEKNPDVIAAFCKASGDSYRFVNDPANREQVIKTIQSIMSLDEATATAFWNQYNGTWPTGVIDEASYAKQEILLPKDATLPARDEVVHQACQDLL